MQPGESVCDRWVIEGLADTGGMGSVYRATDIVTRARVALKVLHRGERRSLERFQVEVAALAEGAEHDGIVKYVDHGMIDERTPFLVMEWIEGESLASRLDDRGVSMRELVALGARLADVLATLHAHGIVHRDLKPSNVMLPKRSVALAKLVDFGIARITSARMLTASGVRIGTLEYMAPEQVRSARTVDGRADVFALGCILFECATGRRPHVADDEVSILAKIVLEDAPRARAVRAEVPEALDAFLARLLERSPDRRPTSAALKDEIARLAAALEGANLAPLPSVPPAEPMESTVMSAPPARIAPVEPLAPTLAPSVVVPESELEHAIAQSVAVSSGKLPGPPTSVLPSPQGALVGREVDVRGACATLRASGATLALWGPAGIGKTRVAVEIARVLLIDAVDGAAYCDLRDALDAEGVLRATCRALGIAPGGSNDDVAATIGRILDARRGWLLVIDHVDAAPAAVASFVAQWRAVAPNARFVLVSRERLRVAGVAVELGPLAASDAAKLFLARAGVAPDPRVDAIVRALEHSPLAIELAAARIGVLGLEGLVERLHRPLDLLGGAGTDEHPLTMREALEWSWAQLDADERRALACASVFRGGFTAQAAEAVIAAPRALDLLQSLRDKSLMTSALGLDAGEARLALWGAVRDLASAKLDELGLADEARARHGDHFAATCRRHAREVTMTGSVTALRAIAAEVDNLLVAVDHALATRAAARALELLLALDPVLATRGPFGRHLELLDAAIGQAAGVDARLVGEARQARARVLSTKGRFDAAAADLDAALASARARGDIEAEALVMLDIGVLEHSKHDLDAAKIAYEKVLELGVSNMHAEARALGNLGAVAHDLRRFDDAYASYVEAIALFESLGDQRYLGLALMNLAVLDEERGKLDDARRRFQRALGCLEAVRDRRLVGIALSNLGTLELERGDWTAALDAQERARVLLADVGDARSEALCLGRLGAALACAGRLDDATAAFAKGERIAARRDVTARDTVKLLRAFLDVARAKAARDANDAEEAKARVEAAEARVRDARAPSVGASSDAPLADRSDDVRAALRALGPMIASLASPD